MRGIRGPAVPWTALGAGGLCAIQIACLAPLSSGRLQGQVDEIRRQLAQIESQQKNNREAIRDLQSPPPPPAAGRFEATEAPATGAPKAPAQSGDTGGEAVYRDGYALYHRGDFEAAERAMRSFVRAHPASPLADNARYWIGEALLARGRYAKAIDEFRALIDRHPSGDGTAPALYKIALCELALGETSRAGAALREILEKHPESDLAPLARERLQGL